MTRSIITNLRLSSITCFCLVLNSFGCAQADNSETDKMTIRQIMKTYYPNNEFYFGATSKATYLTTEKQEMNLFLNEMSYNTPENEFKQSAVYTQPNAEWKSKNYRSLIKMARDNKQVMRAHCPISPQCSKWVKTDSINAAELEKTLNTYMTTISKELEKNSDIILWMDVVNETVCPTKVTDRITTYQPGDWFGPLAGVDRWENPWTKIGFETDGDFRVPVYIRKAFEISNQYAPSIKKLYNQHGGMEDAAWEKVKQTVLYLRKKGQRVDAIGWQAHIPYGFEKVDGNMEKLEKLIQWCHQNNLEFHITELDVRVKDSNDPSVIKGLKHEVADTYCAVTELMLKYIGKGAVGINCWTLTGRYHRNEGGYFAGLFNSDLTPLPAYQRIKDLLIQYAPIK